MPMSIAGPKRTFGYFQTFISRLVGTLKTDKLILRNPMKNKLSPTASGTLAALYQRHRLKFFCPESASELMLGGFAQKEGKDLTITQVGNKAAHRVYRQRKETEN